MMLARPKTEVGDARKEFEIDPEKAKENFTEGSETARQVRILHDAGQEIYLV